MSLELPAERIQLLKEGYTGHEIETVFLVRNGYTINRNVWRNLHHGH